MSYARNLNHTAVNITLRKGEGGGMPQNNNGNNRTTTSNMEAITWKFNYLITITTKWVLSFILLTGRVHSASS